MIYKLDDVKTKLKKLPFDSIIRGEFLGGTYTHWDENGAPMFLMEEKVKDEWKVLNFYCVGIKSFIQTIIDYDTKMKFKQEYPDKQIVPIRFRGIDSWNRPIYKAIVDGKYYGSVTTLFGDNTTEIEANAYFNTHIEELEYFGETYGCEPHGGLNDNIILKIVYIK
jgi:hypothetical protein